MIPKYFLLLLKSDRTYILLVGLQNIIFELMLV